MSRELMIFQVDAFAETPLTGNAARVVPDAEGLTDGEMQRIAREMNVSETAFILPATSSEADVRVRWFTPTTEVPLCGHATIASFHTLAELGHPKIPDEDIGTLKMECASGILPITVTRESGKTPMIGLGIPLPKFQPFEINGEALAYLLGTDQKHILTDLPVLVSDLGFVVVPVDSLETISTLDPDFAGMVRIQQEREFRFLGFAVLTTETIEPDSLIHVRFFCPGAGINEDPVTGSAQGVLGGYVFAQGLIELTAEQMTYKAEQGDEMGRPGRVSVTLETRDGQLASITVAGRAVTALRGTLCL